MKRREERKEKKSSYEYHYLYKTYRWRKLRDAHIAEHPLCVFCEKEGRYTLAKVVDHKEAHKGNEDLFFDSDNLQSLCKLHHDSTKQRMERQNIQCVEHLGFDEQGQPLDVNDRWYEER